MSKTKIFTNAKFPETTIDIEFDNVYGGGVVKQYINHKQPQSMAFQQKGLNVFLEEIKSEGWR